MHSVSSTKADGIVVFVLISTSVQPLIQVLLMLIEWRHFSNKHRLFGLFLHLCHQSLSGQRPQAVVGPPLQRVLLDPRACVFVCLRLLTPAREQNKPEVKRRWNIFISWAIALRSSTASTAKTQWQSTRTLHYEHTHGKIRGLKSFSVVTHVRLSSVGVCERVWDVLTREKVQSQGIFYFFGILFVFVFRSHLPASAWPTLMRQTGLTFSVLSIHII